MSLFKERCAVQVSWLMVSTSIAEWSIIRVTGVSPKVPRLHELGLLDEGARERSFAALRLTARGVVILSAAKGLARSATA